MIQTTYHFKTQTMTNELSTTSILAIFETNKEQRLSFCNDMLTRIDSGEVDPLQVHLQLKCMEDIVKQLTSNTIYKRSILEAAEKYGQKTFQFHEAKVEIKEVGVKYDFSKCGDTVFEMMEQKSKSADADLKQRQDFLKTVPEKGMTTLDELSGEMITVYPPSKSSTTLPVVTLK